MEHKLIKYNKYDLKTCECCKREVDKGYNFTDMILCSECFYTLRRSLNPDYLNKNTLKEFLRDVEFQRNYLKTYCNRYNPYITVAKMYCNNDYTHTADLKPIFSFDLKDGKWVETQETPMLLYDIQHFGVIFFDKIIRIVSKTEPVMISLSTRSIIGDSIFVHTSESDITKGNQMFSFCGPQIYKADGKIIHEMIMGKIIAVKDARRTIISEKCNVKFNTECSPLKDWVYYEAFAQAIKDMRILNSVKTSKELARNIYFELGRTASRYRYNIEKDKYDEETKRKFNEYRNGTHKTGSYNNSEKTGTMNNAKIEALRFFDLDNSFTLKELKKKRNEYLKKYHPDNAGTNMEKYSDYSHKTQMINIYYELLEKEVS